MTILIEKVISAKDREDLIITTKASRPRTTLESLRYSSVAYFMPIELFIGIFLINLQIRPKYSLGTNTWWIDLDTKSATIVERKKSICSK